MLEANRLILDTFERRIEGVVDADSRVEGKVVIEQGASIERSVVRGPAIIARGARIVGAYVGPFTSIGNDVVIQDSEIEHSIVLEGSCVRDLANRVIDSLIGRNVRIYREPVKPSAYRFMCRADAARYQEVRCRSALNRVKGMPFEWTLNPYRGCTHGCHYCYARRYQTRFELGADDEFASIIFVKANFVETLRIELDKPSWKGDYVVVGAATDCYQPIEGHYKLTRGSLEALCARRNPTGVITKGPMIVPVPPGTPR